jgi:hypothetical protein
VIGECPKNPFEMSAVDDQDPVETLPARGADEARSAIALAFGASRLLSHPGPIGVLGHSGEMDATARDLDEADRGLESLGGGEIWV